MDKKTTSQEKSPANSWAEPSIRGNSERVEFSRYKAATNTAVSRRLSLGGGSIDYYLSLDRETLLKLSEHFRKNTTIYPGMIELAAANYIGQNGPNIQPNTSSKSVNRELAKLLEEWQEEPEVRGMDDWVGTNYNWAHQFLYQGDVTAIKVQSGKYAGKIQLLNAWRVGTNRRTSKNANTIKQGVEIDYVGRPQAFYVLGYSTNNESHVIKSNGQRYRAENVLYSANRKFNDQTRGEPALSASFRDIDRLDDILSSQAAAWQLLSRIALSITSKDNHNWTGNTGETDDDSKAGDIASRIVSIPGATIFAGGPTDEIKGIDQKIPGQDFSTNVKMYLRLIGIPLALPIEIILNDWSQTNYTSGRGALSQCFRKFLKLQNGQEKGFVRPWYAWKVNEAVRRRKIPNRSDITKAIVNWPTFPWIDELKEAEAWSKKRSAGIASHTDALSSVGRDREEYLANLEMEIRDAIERAKKIQAETGEEVDWRIFAGLEPMGKTAQAKKLESDGRDGYKPAPAGDEEDEKNAKNKKS